MTEKKSRVEEFKVSGDKLVSKIREILHQGNIRHISIQNEEGKTLIEFPLTLGVVGTLLVPVWAAVGAIAALVGNCTILIEKLDDKSD